MEMDVEIAHRMICAYTHLHIHRARAAGVGSRRGGCHAGDGQAADAGIGRAPDPRPRLRGAVSRCGTVPTGIGGAHTHGTNHPTTPHYTHPSSRNIVVPAQANGAKVKVVSAMYQKSPLGLGLRPDSSIKSLRYVRTHVRVI